MGGGRWWGWNTYNTLLLETNPKVYSQTSLELKAALILPHNIGMVQVTTTNHLDNSKQLETKLELDKVEACHPTPHTYQCCFSLLKTKTKTHFSKAIFLVY